MTPGGEIGRVGPSKAELERRERLANAERQLGRVRNELQALERDALAGLGRRLFRRRWLERCERELQETLARLQR